MTLYWCDGEYMTAKKVRRIKKHEGFNFDRAFNKTVYVDTLGDKIRRAMKKAAYYFVLVVLTAVLMYLIYRTGHMYIMNR